MTLLFQASARTQFFCSNSLSRTPGPKFSSMQANTHFPKWLENLNRPSELYRKLNSPECWGTMENQIAHGNFKFNGFSSVHYLICKGDLNLLEKAIEENGVEALSNSVESPLMVACLVGNIAALKYLLGKGAKINIVDGKNQSALDFAVEANRVDVLRLLLEKNVEQRLLNQALISASRRGSYSTANLLLKYCHVDVLDVNLWTPLFYASALGNMEMAVLLISRGANANLRNKRGNTPMIVAMTQGQYNIAKYLIESGALPDTSNCSESTALIIAANQGSLDMVKYFVQRGAKLDKVSSKGTALKGAVMSNNFELVKYIVETIEKLPHYATGNLLESFLNQHDDDGCTALIHAFKHKTADIVRFLAEKGSSICIYDKKGVLPMHLAAKHGALDTIKYFFEDGDVLTDIDRSGRGILSYAVAGGNLEVIEFLIEEGLDINQRDDENNYPLICACRSKSVGAVEFLLQNGVVQPQDNPAIIHAARTGEVAIVKLLIDYGAELDCWPDQYCGPKTTPLLEAVFSKSFDMVKFLIDAGADVNLRMEDHSPFTAAIASNNYVMASYLVERGAHPHEDDPETGENELHRACYYQDKTRFDYMLQFDSCLNQQDRKGRTPLFVAATKLMHREVEKLVARGTDVNIVDWNEESALGSTLKCLQDFTKDFVTGIAKDPGADNSLLHRTVKCLVDNGANVDEIAGDFK